MTIGGSTWQTAVFPGEDGNYALLHQEVDSPRRRHRGRDVVIVKLRTIER